MTKSWLSIAFSGLVCVQTSVAFAGNSLTDLVANTGLAPSDYSIMESEARKLYDPLKPPGTVQTWTNAQTGSSGQVSLRRVQNNCVELMHNVRRSGSDRVFKYRAWRCRNADGRWLLDVRPN